MAQILKAWHAYDDVNLVNIKQLKEQASAIDLSQFAVKDFHIIVNFLIRIFIVLLLR